MATAIPGSVPFAAIVVALCAGCAESHDPDCSTGPYGFERCALLTEVPDSQATAFCEWYFGFHGGEERAVFCPGRPFHLTFRSVEGCEAELAGLTDGCSVTASEYETCIRDWVENECAYTELCSNPECVPSPAP